MKCKKCNRREQNLSIKNTNVSIWHVGMIFIGGPTKSQDFVGKRRSSGMSEPCRFRQGERYGACDDVQGLGKATPQQDSSQDKISILAKFGPAVESCSIKSAFSLNLISLYSQYRRKIQNFRDLAL